MRKILRNNKGITLIALIITVIVLLVLATVSIKLLIDSGIVVRAKNSTNKYNTAQINEIDQLEIVENEMAKYDQGTSEWWKLTDAEKEELKDHTDKMDDGTVMGIMVATAEVEIKNMDGELVKQVGPVVYLEGGREPLIYVFKDGVVCYYHLATDEKADLLQQVANEGNLGITIQKGKWYASLEGNTLEEVTESPYSIDDFEEIYCRTYIDRVLNSFGK